MKTKYVSSFCCLAIMAIFTSIAHAGSADVKTPKVSPAPTCRATNTFKGIPSTLDVVPKSAKPKAFPPMVTETWTDPKRFPDLPRLASFVNELGENDYPLFRHMDFDTIVSTDRQSATDYFSWSAIEHDHSGWSWSMELQIQAAYAIDNIGRPIEAYRGFLAFSLRH